MKLAGVAAAESASRRCGREEQLRAGGEEVWHDKGDTGGKHGAMEAAQTGSPRTCLGREVEVKCMCEINTSSDPPRG